MSHLRPLEPVDIPQVVDLRRRVFTKSAQTSDASLAEYYRELLFENPWHDERFPSLVHEGEDGDITGFIGAIPRRLLLGDKRITAITSTDLMVAPEARGLVGPKLLRRLFEGAQDVTYSDRSTDQARTLYEALGGSSALWYSLYWTVPLDGSRVSFGSGGGSGADQNLAARALRRAARTLDRLSDGVNGSSSRRITTGDEPLAAETVVGIMQRLAAQATLVPEYDAGSFAWLLARLSERKTSGRIVTRQVTLEKAPIGWFVYEVRPDGEADVVQLGALAGREQLVLDHLIHHARVEDATVLHGRLDRRFARAISDRGFPLTLGQPWTVVRSLREDVSAQFLSGNAFFTRLDAEWWIGT